MDVKSGRGMVMLGAGIICAVLAAAVVMRFIDLYSGRYPGEETKTPPANSAPGAP